MGNHALYLAGLVAVNAYACACSHSAVACAPLPMFLNCSADAERPAFISQVDMKSHHPAQSAKVSAASVASAIAAVTPSLAGAFGAAGFPGSAAMPRISRNPLSSIQPPRSVNQECPVLAELLVSGYGL